MKTDILRIENHNGVAIITKQIQEDIDLAILKLIKEDNSIWTLNKTIPDGQD